MDTTNEQYLRIPRGGILYDSTQVQGSAEQLAQLFEPDYWLAKDAAQQQTGGRGSVWFIDEGTRQWVLRHYRRGGWAARLSADRYVWCGASATRAFREWRLLTRLHAAQLPVPAPIAARFIRYGMSYRADLLTATVPQAHTLAQVLSQQALSPAQWDKVGVTLARFHYFGVQHADLNANNILIDSAGAVYLLDFDRGRLRALGAWQHQVLARLLRSLHKLKVQRAIQFEQQHWDWLLAGYQQQLRNL